MVAQSFALRDFVSFALVHSQSESEADDGAILRRFLKDYRSGKEGVTLFPIHSRKKRGNGWGTRTVFGCRINRGNPRDSNYKCLGKFVAFRARTKPCPETFSTR